MLIRGSQSLPSNRIFGDPHFTRTRFRSSFVPLRGLRLHPDNTHDPILNKNWRATGNRHAQTFLPGAPGAPTRHTLHGNRAWLPHHLCSVRYHRLLGSRPKRRNLEGLLHAPLNAVNGPVARSSFKRINQKSVSLIRLSGSLRVRQFVHYVHLHASHTASAGTSVFTRRLRRVKDKRYFKPYIFVGLKKVPKYLRHSPHKALFRRARRLLRKRRVSKIRTEPKAKLFPSPVSRRSAITRASGLIGAAQLPRNAFAQAKPRRRAQ